MSCVVAFSDFQAQVLWLTLACCRAVRVIDCNGNGAIAQVIAGLEWLGSNYKLPAVAQLSLGSNSIDTALDTALQSVVALGVTGVVAAGNYDSGTTLAVTKSANDAILH